MQGVDPFSYSFVNLKLRYAAYDDMLTNMNFLNRYDKVNIFINLETVLRNLSMIKDLERTIVLYSKFNNAIIAHMLNLAGHYNRFFKNNTFDTKVYLYHTDLHSTEFNQFKYNEDYRSYYLTKFNQNPKFTYLTDKLNNDIIPEAKLISEYIPNVYYITSQNIEGSLIPYIIGESDKSRKNIIMGGEFYDTQYSGIDNYTNFYIHRTPMSNGIYTDLPSYISYLSKKPVEEINSMIDTYGNYSMYCTLISSLGDRDRSIDGLNKIGPVTLDKLVRNGVHNNKIKLDTNNPEVIKEIIPKELQDNFVNNYYCTNLRYMYDELTDGEKNSVLSQINDKSDINSLKRLNQTDFYDTPIILEQLL